MKKNSISSLFIVCLLSFVSIISFGQGFGGKIKLKFTYEGAPLVGYDITTSINKIDVSGGKGVTDSEGIVNLNTEPLPIGNLDVKGEINCNNSNKKFEASGFVYVSPSGNGNYYELKLEEVAKQMAEFSGMSIDLIMESFGVECARKGGSTTQSSSNTETSNNSGSTNNSTVPDNSNSSGITGSNDVSAADQQKTEHDTWSAENEKKREESAAKRDEFMTNGSPEQGYQNQKDVLTNQIYKLDKKIEKKESDLNISKLKPKEKNDLQYDIKELKVEKAIKQNKLDKVNAIIGKGNKPLNKSEKAPYKAKEETLKDELDQVKEDHKKGVTLVSSTDNNMDGVDMEELGAYTEEEVKNMSDVKLRSVKVGVKTKLGKKKMSLKTKAKIMKQDKKETLEKEIELLQNTIDFVESEVAKRKEEK